MQCPSCGVALPSDARFCSGCGQPIPGARGPVSAQSSTWVIVIVVCVVALGMVMVAGVIAAIAIPNLLTAIDRGKQKRTLADMATIERALEAYAQAHSGYPVADDLETLRSRLVPEYAKTLPALDGWGNALQVHSQEATYTLVSFGKGGTPDGCDGGESSRFEDDICIQDGEFTQWPERIQRSERVHSSPSQ